MLFIMALLAAAAMPAMESAFTEQALRGDAHQLAMMVKTAMLKSREQQRPYLLVLDGTTLSLEPAPASVNDSGDTPPVTAEPSTDKNETTSPSTSEDATEAQIGNVLKFLNAEKKNAWENLPAAHWLFEPAGLCPLPRVRLERGAAYIEMSFNALTGNVEDEASYIP